MSKRQCSSDIYVALDWEKFSCSWSASCNMHRRARCFVKCNSLAKLAVFVSWKLPLDRHSASASAAVADSDRHGHAKSRLRSDMKFINFTYRQVLPLSTLSQWATHSLMGLVST